MIDEARTLELFGYTSDMWAPQSHKCVVAVCEECGRYRVVKKQLYRDMCLGCGHSGRKHWGFGKPRSDAVKAKISVAHIGMVLSEETRKKLSKAHKGKGIGEDNPMFGKAAWNRGHHLSDDHKRKLSESVTGFRHSDATRKRMSKNANPRRGKDNNMWKGGVTPVMKALRCSATYSKWRSLIFKRDDWTCQVCNVRGGSLQAHHIRPVRDHKNDLLIFDVDNGITLCNGCHDTTKNHEHDFISRFDAIIGAKK